MSHEFNPRGTVDFCHQSVKDFLLSCPEDAWYHISAASADIFVFQVCWKYLTAKNSSGRTLENLLYTRDERPSTAGTKNGTHERLRHQLLYQPGNSSSEGCLVTEDPGQGIPENQLCRREQPEGKSIEREDIC